MSHKIPLLEEKITNLETINKSWEHTDSIRIVNEQELIKKNKFVDEVNHGICRRIENINEGDANKNALTILNIAGLMVNLELENRLDSLKYLFKNW